MTENDLSKLLSQNKDISNNRYRFYPKQIFITDSYNNPLYPFKEIVYDKYSFDLPKYKRFLEKEVFGNTLDFLPFHFWIEFIENDYYIINTRPLYLKPVITDDRYSHIRNSYIVMICGDTNRDIYPREFQNKLFKLLNSLYRLLTEIQSIPKTSSDFIKPLNINMQKILSHELYTKITSKD